jgi:gamma-glutamyltranspeptidase/glutathione hydrolase
MRLEQVLRPAIDVARHGFTVRPQFSRFIAYNQKKFSAFPQTATLYLRDGKPLAPGTSFQNPDLAGAYTAIARGGARAFYEGPIAEAIVKVVDDPAVATGITNVRKGVLARADLRNYEARLRLPVRSTYRGYEIYGMPLPSRFHDRQAQHPRGYELHRMPRAEAGHLHLESCGWHRGPRRVSRIPSS